MNASPLPQRDDELFDVVNERDQVVRQATRGEVHRLNLLHRAVHVWLIDERDRVLLQMRSPNKDQYPSTWTSSASGHVDAGEDYGSAAVRELAEELGLQLPLQVVTKLPASPATAFEFTSLWVGKCNTTPTPDPVEVQYVEWWPLDDAVTGSADEATPFSPPLRALLQWWRRNESSR